MSRRNAKPDARASESTLCTPTDTNNYSTPSAVSVTLTVNSAPLTITASSPTVAYNSAVPVITPIYAGFVNNETSSTLSKAPACTTAYSTSSAAGSAPSTSCSGASAANYAITYKSGSITVLGSAPPPVTINFSYSGGSLTLSWSQGTLLEANNVNGPWVTNNAPSPYTVAPIGPQKFFKVQTR